MSEPRVGEPSAGLLERIERLEALESCRNAFHQYLHFLDGGMTEDLLGVFSETARLEVMNFPPGSGQDLLHEGREEIRKLYSQMGGGPGRHHAANVSIDVSADASHADLSSYFLTSMPHMLSGGLYEVRLEPCDGHWRISWMRITSSWGWLTPAETPPFLGEKLSVRTLREGWPVIFAETSQSRD